MKTTRKQSSLEEIVGNQVYTVWVDMLRRLVPEGRTHRLAPMIAGMLQYAMAIATEKYGDNAEAGSVAEKLFAAYDEDPEAAEENLMPILRKLFKDASVEYERIAKSGEHHTR